MTEDLSSRISPVCARHRGVDDDVKDDDEGLVEFGRPRLAGYQNEASDSHPEQQRRRKQAILQLRSQKHATLLKSQQPLLSNAEVLNFSIRLPLRVSTPLDPKNSLYSTGTRRPFRRKEIPFGGKSRSADLLPCPICHKKDIVVLCPNIRLQRLRKYRDVKKGW